MINMIIYYDYYCRIICIVDLIQFRKYLDDEKKRCLIFDFDKTLCSLQTDWSQWYIKVKKLFKEYDLEFKPRDFRETVNRQNEFIKRFGKEIRDKIVKINRDCEKNNFKGYSVSKLLVKFAKENKKRDLFIWSSNDSRTIIPILKGLGIQKSFTKIIARDQVIFIKPNIDGFKLINSLKRPLSEYLMIGDSNYDKMAAKNVGICYLDIFLLNGMIE